MGEVLEDGSGRLDMEEGFMSRPFMERLGPARVNVWVMYCVRREGLLVLVCFVGCVAHHEGIV